MFPFDACTTRGFSAASTTPASRPEFSGLNSEKGLDPEPFFEDWLSSGSRFMLGEGLLWRAALPK